MNRISIVDMCKYIEANIYKEKYNEDLIFGYLKTIVKSLALHKGFFKNIQDYEPYSIMTATRVFLRLTNKKQFLPEDDPNKLAKVKSVLNMIKSLLYPCKVDFQQQAYNENTKSINKQTEDNTSIENYIIEEIQSVNRPILEAELNSYLKCIHRLLWKVIEDTPYSSLKYEKYELYTSLLLTFVRSVTLSNINKDRIINNKPKGIRQFYIEIMDSIYQEELDSAPITWHIDKNLTDYIKILLVRARELIVREIQELMHYNIYSEDFVLRALSESIQENEDD